MQTKIGIEVLWDALKDLKGQVKHKVKPSEEVIDEILNILWLRNGFMSFNELRQRLHINHPSSSHKLKKIINWMRTNWDDIMSQPFKHETKQDMFLITNPNLGYRLTKNKEEILEYSKKVKETKLLKIMEELQIDLLFAKREIQEEEENELQSQNDKR